MNCSLCSPASLVLDVALTLLTDDTPALLNIALKLTYFTIVQLGYSGQYLLTNDPRQ